MYAVVVRVMMLGATAAWVRVRGRVGVRVGERPGENLERRGDETQRCGSLAEVGGPGSGRRCLRAGRLGGRTRGGGSYGCDPRSVPGR